MRRRLMARSLLGGSMLAGSGLLVTERPAAVRNPARNWLSGPKSSGRPCCADRGDGPQSCQGTRSHSGTLLSNSTSPVHTPTLSFHSSTFSTSLSTHRRGPLLLPHNPLSTVHLGCHPKRPTAQPFGTSSACSSPSPSSEQQPMEESLPSMRSTSRLRE